MADKSTSQCYEAVCSAQGIKMNSNILNALEETAITGNLTLNLTGNRLKNIQRLGDPDVLALSKCLQNSGHVTDLDMRYNNISDEGAGHLADLLQPENSTLRVLNLMFNDIQMKGAEVLASSLQCNSRLLSLKLSGNKIGNSGAMYLVSMLQVNNTLQELELSECDLATQSVIALSIMLKNNTALRSVDISRPLLFSHQEEWVVHFSEMLAVNCSLVELHLGKTGLTDTGMERLSEGLRLNHHLRYLDLHCNRVSRDGACHLAKVLTQNMTLEIINLSFNRIEDEGATYLSKAITWSGCVLKELSVKSNNIRSEGLLSLAQAMKKNKTLTHIYIWGNHPEELACEAFRDLISSGRLPPEQTDVRAYEVDGQVFLAEVFHSLRKQINCTDCTRSDTCSDLDTTRPSAADMSSDVALSPEATFPLHIK
ncbi:leucine-rich repeat-containing protein 34 isoform X2 [Melanotaenia boesemani]|uniref:leucine-rich repeat-containing protein 34 isoform X2 n=1 Tax=Melanotaenia boesemani TaxID=1250792 RepID=UPI001C04380E|nr:leucine-rich repeat-containing protein 34 isoform X2 [Melanotaenia boesemani]